MTSAGEVVRQPGSFRDPYGFVYTRDGVLLRQVERAGAAAYDRFLGSGCYDALVDAGLLVAHVEADPSLAATPGAHRVLRPERLPFVAHPAEWCPAQRRDAALVTLDAQAVAADHGLTLRDASAFNVGLRDGRAVLIDTLSFGPATEGAPWAPYRQFCQHFLAPLALETLVDVRLARRLLLADVDGIPLDLAAGLLPGRTRLRPGLATHLHAHARAARPRAPSARTRTARFSSTALEGLVASLRSTVSKLTWDPDTSPWVDYYATADHYSPAAMAAKQEAVAAWVADLSPTQVWDLGANTGRFAHLAADAGADVVAFDVDPAVVERAWQGPRRGDAPGSVLPLVLDLSNPTPAVGWANRERPSLAGRGPVDVVLALALVHHLAIGGGVPLPAVAAGLAGLGRHAIVEWVPKDDPMAASLLATREDVFTDHTTEGFERALAGSFDVRDRLTLPDTGRALYLLERRP